jgi:YEATS family
VNESGWGEFEIQMKVYFHDSSERALTLFHHLELHHKGDAAAANTGKSVTIEHYDEIVLRFVLEISFFRCFLSRLKRQTGYWSRIQSQCEMQSTVQDHLIDSSLSLSLLSLSLDEKLEEEELQMLTKATETVADLFEAYRDRLRTAEALLKTTQSRIDALENI